MEPLDNQSMSGDQLTSVVREALRTTHPWMTFMAILGMVFLLINVGSLFITSSFQTTTVLILSIIGLIVSFVMYLFLLQSASGIKKFSLNSSSATLEEMFKKYKETWMIFAGYIGFSILSGIISFRSTMNSLGQLEDMMELFQNMGQ